MPRLWVSSKAPINHLAANILTSLLASYFKAAVIERNILLRFGKCRFLEYPSKNTKKRPRTNDAKEQCPGGFIVRRYRRCAG